MKFNELCEAVLPKYAGEQWSMLLDGYLPISPAIQKRIHQSTENIVSYHATNIIGLKNLIGLQNKSNSISTASRMEFVVLNGCQTSGGVILKLRGTSLFSSDGDAWTIRDTTGMRWINMDEDKLKFLIKNKKEIANIYNNIKEIAKTVAKDFIPTADKMETDEIKDAFQNLSKKEIKTFIVKCFKELEKTLKSFDWKNLSDLFFRNNSYNEIILNKFEILDVIIQSTVSNDIKDNHEEVRKLYDEISSFCNINVNYSGFIADISGDVTEKWEKSIISVHKFLGDK